MSTSEKLAALDEAAPPAPWTEPRWWTHRPASESANWEVTLRNALPQFRALVAAAEAMTHGFRDTGDYEEGCDLLDERLADLDKALGEQA